jgi:hypothetical protein
MSANLFDVCSTLWRLPSSVLSSLLYCLMSTYRYIWCLPTHMIAASLYDVILFWISDIGLIRHWLNIYRISQSDIRYQSLVDIGMIRYRTKELNIGDIKSDINAYLCGWIDTSKTKWGNASEPCPFGNSGLILKGSTNPAAEIPVWKLLWRL